MTDAPFCRCPQQQRGSGHRRRVVFRTPAAEYAALPLKRPASETPNTPGITRDADSRITSRWRLQLMFRNEWELRATLYEKIDPGRAPQLETNK
jgi:hypothetical protein